MSKDLMSKQKAIIVICTYKRPQMLTACIASILSQLIPDNWVVEILIVDNDAAQSAEDIFMRFSQNNVMPLSYICEKNHGIPFARNKGCEVCLEKNADWILFIDDDETADPNWLMAYFEATKKYQSDVYSGPVCYIFPTDYANWLGNKGDSETPDGGLKKRASTNNVLIHKKLIEKLGYNLSFDIQMALTGGEDKDFFVRYEALGGKIIHVSQAIVTEKVTENRLSILWRLKRQYSSSTNRVYINKKMMGQKKANLLSVKETIRHLFDGVLGLIICPLFLIHKGNIFKRRYYHALRHIAKATGNIAGIFNIQIESYKKTDGF
jgi:succinoglycan biosynthesis protein ExoM